MFGLSYEDELHLHSQLALGMICISVPIFAILYWVIPSPWGKTFSKSQWYLGPLLPARLSWFLFESPNLVWSFVCYRQVENTIDPVNLFFLLLFVGHYIQRAILYPILMSSYTKRMPTAVVLSAFFFCSCNGYLQAQSLCRFSSYPDDYWYDPRFLLGTMLFYYGIYINLQSDALLRRLRKQSSSYQIPKGGWFDLVSAPHYFGEILEWTGFCLATQSLAAFAFVIFTAANLIPRGVAHHAWYQTAFRDKYPCERKAILPFLF